MGWLALAGLAAAAGLLLWRLGFSRQLWMFGAAAVMLAAAGYAWQGQPGQAATPARPVATGDAGDSERIALRDAMTDRFGPASAYAVAGDAMLRAGSPDAAVRAILGGIGAYPESLALWTELGSVLAQRDRALSPAAKFAFARASSLNPKHPAPYFFLGLAQVKDQDFVAARRSWANAYALTPEAASYRRDIAIRLTLLDRLLATMSGEPEREGLKK